MVCSSCLVPLTSCAALKSGACAALESVACPALESFCSTSCSLAIGFSNLNSALVLHPWYFQIPRINWLLQELIQEPVHAGEIVRYFGERNRSADFFRIWNLH